MLGMRPCNRKDKIDKVLFRLEKVSSQIKGTGFNLMQHASKLRRCHFESNSKTTVTSNWKKSNISQSKVKTNIKSIYHLLRILHLIYAQF